MQVTSQLRTFSVEQGSLRSRVWGEGWTYGSSYGWEQFYIEVWSRNGKTCISKGNDLTASANLPDQWLSLQVILEPSIGNREGKFCILLPFYFFLQISSVKKIMLIQWSHNITCQHFPSAEFYYGQISLKELFHYIYKLACGS